MQASRHDTRTVARVNTIPQSATPTRRALLGAAAALTATLATGAPGAAAAPAEPDAAEALFAEWLEAAREHNRALDAAAELPGEEYDAIADDAGAVPHEILDELAETKATTLRGAVGKLQAAMYHVVDGYDPGDPATWRPMDEECGFELALIGALMDLRRLVHGSAGEVA